LKTNNIAARYREVIYGQLLDLEMPYWMMRYAELIDLFIDRSDPGASTQMAFMRQVLQTLRAERCESDWFAGGVS
jgi:hypothetical protein